MTTHAHTPSIIGFKNPRADLHRMSPKIFWGSLALSVLTVVVAINLPLFVKEEVEKVYTPPPVVIQLENIPETRQQVTAPAPSLAIPLEVADDMLLDDVTIESTDLDVMETPADIGPLIDVQDEIVAEVVEEEIFEFFAVEEQPERQNVVAPEYPETARRAGIEGRVFVTALVGKDGRVEAAEILQGPEELHEAAIAAAMQTIFTPAKMNDMPVKCWVQLPFTFELE